MADEINPLHRLIEALGETDARVYMSGGEWRIEVTEQHLRAAVDTVAPLLVQQGRRDAARDIRAHLDDQMHQVCASDDVEAAARIAEGNTDHG